MRYFFLATLFTVLPIHDLLGQTMHLDQGWTSNEREEFYFTAQGSQLIPYKWFLELEQADNSTRFRDPSNMRRYGMLTTETSERNPDGLPIGFVRDGVDPVHQRIASLPQAQMNVVEAATRFQVKSAYLGPQFDEKLYPMESKSWFGLTCAACHTHELEYSGKTIRIAGGSTQSDLESFLRDLGLSLKSTYEDSRKLARFSEGVGRNADDIGEFRTEVQQISEAVNRLVERNKAKHRYGFARLDAFGAILNAVCETALNEPMNRRESNAPVSYPTLWNTPRMSFVQWGATAPFPEARNIGEVLGVFASYSVTPGPQQFDSTVRLKHLIRLEHGLIDKLTSPQWPEDVFPKLDAEKVKRGETLFAQNCRSCHDIRGEDGHFAVNSIGRIPIRSSTVAEIGTDPQFLMNLAKTNIVSTGVLAPFLGGQLTAPRTQLLAVAGREILKKCAEKEHVDLSLLVPGSQSPPHPSGSGYIARPLEGIWSSAPYFHNGSVPNLYETLLPQSQRSKTFWMGSRRFDPVNVGYETDRAELGYQFEVFDGQGNPIPGNSNAGHEGHGASDEEGFTETFENGAWREFTEVERYDLVEYMKWLPARSNVRFERIPAGEGDRIANIIALTAKQMQNRYPDGNRMLRGVHPKDHGCVTAKFEVLGSLPEDLHEGVFRPGAVYSAFVRFSNAAGVVGPDSRLVGTSPAHGSRGMAIKLMGVRGDSLLPLHGALTQDFLMVNQPAFAFANVEDYEVLSQVLLDTKDQKPEKFFETQFSSGSPEAKARAQRTLEISKRIAANAVDGVKGAFEAPPASPADSTYFSAAPFMFGSDRVMRFRASPTARSMDEPNVNDPNYLRTALIRRLKTDTVVYDFSVQVRYASRLNLDNDIENASLEWPDDFVTVARLTIPPQEFDSPEQRLICEELFFTPWHGITEHRPIGGINRLRRAVYEASGKFRNLPKEPTAGR